jgi:hypothetical protein
MRSPEREQETNRGSGIESRRRAALLFAPALLATACGGASPANPVEAWLRLSGTSTQSVQYVPGALPDEPVTPGGPAIHMVGAPSRVTPGAAGRSLSGSAEQGASAVLIGLEGDVGYYVVPVNGLDTDNPPDVQFTAQATFSTSIPIGPALVHFRGVSPAGLVGPVRSEAMSVDALQPVTGTLVISLTWDTEADLDLHVVTPSPMADGKPVELWSGNRTSLPARSPLEGGPYTDEELAAAGIFDFDSNSQCTIDGRRLETVSWQVPPPAGHYIVRVDTFSMCGQAAARWTLTATLNGESIAGTYAGVSIDSDTRYPHKAGAGLKVVEFDL